MKGKIISVIVCGTLLYLVFLFRLDSFSIRPWDESTFAVNVYEMLHGHHYLVPYFNGSIDNLTTKPLLSRWIQMLFVSLLGYNELAIRLPSAIAGILTACFLFSFIKKNCSVLWAWCSFVVLITSIGFVHFHTARTGDSDAILTLFLFLSNIYFYYFIQTDENKNSNIILYFLFFGLAFGAKSLAALLFIPAHIFIILYQKKFKAVLSLKGFYTGVLVFLGLAAFFILSRQIHDPNYINNVINNDASRLLSVIDLHKEPFDFYFNNFYNYRFSCWVAIFVLGAVLLWRQGQEANGKAIFIWCISLLSVYLCIISYSVTKLEWYDMPLYPYMAIIAGYALYYCLQHLPGVNPAKAATPFLITLVFSVPLYYSIKQSHDNDRKPGDRKLERIEDYIFEKSRQGFNFDNYTICDNGYIGPLLFYKYKLQDKGQQIKLADTSAIQAPTMLIATNDSIKNYVLQKFNCTVADSYNELVVLNVKSRK